MIALTLRRPFKNSSLDFILITCYVGQSCVTVAMKQQLLGNTDFTV